MNWLTIPILTTLLYIIFCVFVWRETNKTRGVLSLMVLYPVASWLMLLSVKTGGLAYLFLIGPIYFTISFHRFLAEGDKKLPPAGRLAVFITSFHVILIVVTCLYGALF